MPAEAAALQREAAAGDAGPPPNLVALPALQTWTRLRPGVRAFLEQAHTICELHIYTMGDRAYARAMAAVLDPEGRLFSGRVISAVRQRKGEGGESCGGSVCLFSVLPTPPQSMFVYVVTRTGDCACRRAQALLKPLATPLPDSAHGLPPPHTPASLPTCHSQTARSAWSRTWTSCWAPPSTS